MAGIWPYEPDFPFSLEICLALHMLYICTHTHTHTHALYVLIMAQNSEPLLIWSHVGLQICCGEGNI